MQLGAFSVSLAVKDIEKSKSFYESIGFSVFGGNLSQNWLILKNEDHTIGLFQGMFPKNILTFNPGWDKDCKTLENYSDIRELASDFKSKGLELIGDPITTKSGPASFTLTDPDGNSILIDQHV